MLFNNYKPTYGPTSWIAPESLGTMPFMRGDYVPVYRMVSRDKQSSNLSGIRPSTYYSGWFEDFVKKKVQDKIDECTADPESCAEKLTDLRQRLQKENCSDYRFEWRKKRCRKRRQELEENISLIQSIVAKNPKTLTLPGSLPASSAPIIPVLPSSVTAPLLSDYSDEGIKPMTIGLIGLGVVALGVTSYFLLRGK